MPPGLHRNHHIKAVTPGQITDRSRNNPQALRLINDSDAIDLLDDIGSIVKGISLSNRERLLLICDRPVQRFSAPTRRGAKAQKSKRNRRARGSIVSCFEAFVAEIRSMLPLPKFFMELPNWLEHVGESLTLSLCCNMEA